MEIVKSALRPYFTGYWMMSESVKFRQPQGTEDSLEKNLVHMAQMVAGGVVRRGEVSPVVLSIDMSKNCLHSMVDIGAMQKTWDGAQHYYTANMEKLREMSEKLKVYLGPSVPSIIARPKL